MYILNFPAKKKENNVEGHTVQNLHFLSKNSTLISREIHLVIHAVNKAIVERERLNE